MSPLDAVRRLRSHYTACRVALPWLDVSADPGDAPAFPVHARYDETEVAPPTRLVRVGSAEAAIAIGLERLAQERGILVLRATELDCDAVLRLAHSCPQLPIVYESGERKILYAIDAIEAMLAAAPNIHLSTYNFCNWLGLERLCARGLYRQILFGGHAPRHSVDAAMGPIILSRLGWQRKCAIAGDNLRRLLGMPTPEVAEIATPWLPIIICDAHAHCVTGRSPLSFPTPDQRFGPDDWLATLDEHGIERICLVPNEALYDWRISARAAAAPLIEHRSRRFRFYAIFDPRSDQAARARLRGELGDPACVGLKIHPSFHQVAADDPAYRPAFDLALETGKPILTHSWAVSPHNPAQALSLPSRFHRHLEWVRQRDPAGRGVTLILGHAGGRPEAFDEVVALCRRHPQVRVDTAGDYYDNGVIDALVAALGARAVLFGSDADWTDPRCVLGMVLASRCRDDEVAAILRRNAEETLALGAAESLTTEIGA